MSLEISSQAVTDTALGQVMPAAIQAAYGKGSGGRNARKRVPSLAATRARLSFVQSAVRRKENLQAFVAGYRKSPAGATEARNLFAQNPLEAIMRRGMAPYGFSTSNLADVTAAYLGSAYYVSRRDPGNPTKAQMIGLRDQVARAYAAIPRIVRANDATKQKLADTLMAQILVDHAVAMNAKGDAVQARRAASNVGATARRAFGIDLSRYALTTRGLAPR